MRITNANNPLFHGIIDPLDFNPYPQKPNIHKFFTAFGWKNEIGSGIRNTNKYLPMYADGAKPVFYENDTFVTEIPLVNLTLAHFADEWNNWMQFSIDAKAHFSESLRQFWLPAAFADNAWPALLLHLVPCWHQKGTQLTSLK